MIADEDRLLAPGNIEPITSSESVILPNLEELRALNACRVWV